MTWPPDAAPSGASQAAPARPSVRAALPLHSPLWTYVLLAINAVVFLAMTASGGSESVRVLVRYGAKVNPLIVAGQYWRFVAPVFLHIGFIHLAFNAYALYLFGQDVERLFGRARFLALYLLAGVSGVVASFVGSEAISAGASGAIFGLVGAMLVYFAVYRDNLGRFGRQRLTSLLLITVLNLAWGFLGTGIDNLGHIGGLLAGLLMGWAYLPRYRAATPDLPWEPPRLVDAHSPARAVLVSLLFVVVLALLAWWGLEHWRGVYAA